MASPSELLSMAASLIRAHNHSDARKILDAVLVIEPSNVQALLWKSEVANTDQEKKEILEQVLKLDPDNRSAKYNLMLLTHRQNTGESTTQTNTAASTLKIQDQIQYEFNDEAAPIQNLAWICPKCRSHNHSPISLHSPLAVTCPVCSCQFTGASGYVEWAQIITSWQYDDIFLDCIIRLTQHSSLPAQFSFTLRTPDYAIVEGDYLVVLSRVPKPGKAGVDYLDNKTSGLVIFPSG